MKVRASSLNNVLANGKNGLSVGAKSYVQEKAKEFLYGVQKEFSNKYVLKGNIVEDENIKFYGDYKGWDLAKNEEQFSDNHFTGTPDIIHNDTIIDIKSSWDCFTFPLWDDKIKNKDYIAQLQCYMHITGIRKAILAYVLTDTPEELEHHATFNYVFIAPELRIKEFEIDYDPEFMQDAIKKVKMCQDYFKELTEPYKSK